MSAADYNNRSPEIRAQAHIIWIFRFSCSRCKLHRITLLAFLLLLSAPEGFSFQKTSPAPQLPGMPPQENPEPTVPAKMQRDMDKKANEQRQAELKRDTEKLVQLSTELKEYVDKTNQNVLSVEVVRKAEEIEHLAHSVKTKMRDGH